MSDYVDPANIHRSNLAGFDFEHLRASVATAGESPAFISVGGPSAVGKTTLSHLLIAELPDTTILPIDSYLIEGLGSKAGQFSDVPPDPTIPFIGGITPEVWDMDLLEADIQRLKLGEPIDLPIFDETIKDRIGYRELVAGKHVVLEGGHTFSERFRDYGDYRVLVVAPFHDRLMRKIVRTHLVYGRDDLDDIVGRYMTKDEPSWRFYEPEFREMADQVFDNPASPHIDYAHLPQATYPAEEGIVRNLLPLPVNGVLHHGEQLRCIEQRSGESQLSYSVEGRELVNLPLAKEFVTMLEAFYVFTPEDTAV